MSRTSREWRTSERFNLEAQDGSLSDGSQDLSGSSGELLEGSQEARDECCLYGANEPGKDESSLSMLQELFDDKAQKSANALKPQQTQVPIKTQGPVKARRFTDSLPKQPKTSFQTPVSKPQDRTICTEDLKKTSQIAESGDLCRTGPFRPEEDSAQPHDSQKKRVESKLKRINSKESISSKKSNTSKRSKANSKRGSGSGIPKMKGLEDVIKFSEARANNSNFPSLHQIETDRPSKTQDSNSSAMPPMLNNLINQAVCNSSSLKQKTEHLINKDLSNQWWSERRSPHKVLKQNPALAPESFSKTGIENPPETSTWQSSNPRAKAVAMNLAKIFSRSTAHVDQAATQTTSQPNTVSNEPQPILSMTLLKSKIFSAEKKAWFNSNQKTSTDPKKRSSIFDSNFSNADKKDQAPQEDQDIRSPDSQLQKSNVLDGKQPRLIKHLIEELKSQPNRHRQEVLPKKPDKEEKDSNPKQTKQLDTPQRLSKLARNLQSAVQN